MNSEWMPTDDGWDQYECQNPHCRIATYIDYVHTLDPPNASLCPLCHQMGARRELGTLSSAETETLVGMLGAYAFELLGQDPDKTDRGSVAVRNATRLVIKLAGLTEEDVNRWMMKLNG